MRTDADLKRMTDNAAKWREAEAARILAEVTRFPFGGKPVEKPKAAPVQSALAAGFPN